MNKVGRRLVGSRLEGGVAIFCQVVFVVVQIWNGVTVSNCAIMEIVLFAFGSTSPEMSTFPMHSRRIWHC